MLRGETQRKKGESEGGGGGGEGEGGMVREEECNRENKFLPIFPHTSYIPASLAIVWSSFSI